MNMKTLLLPARYTPDSVALENTARNLGWQTERLTDWKRLDFLRGQEVALHQEFALAHVVAAAAGIALIAAPHDWLATLPIKYCQRSVHATTIRELGRFTTPMFIKDACEKRLRARVYQNMRDLLREENIFPELPILVAEPVVWEIEFRCFVLERKVAAFSPYFRYGQMAQNLADEWWATPEEVASAQLFVRQLLADQSVSLPSATVIDVGKIAGRGWAVVELNPVWASGLYGCQPAAVLSVLSRACIPQDQVTVADRQWIWQA